ncbi:hypothetical protein K2E96_29890 [Pseudomonas sp. ERGC3:05]|nr:hypothetical protein [Pseudomonas sp. ERGC3:01]QZC94775.1 hypothetical protein K2E96_29890 [Pseudomonas sp. ERGC3:05]
MTTTLIRGGAGAGNGKNASVWWNCHTAPAPSPQKCGDGPSKVRSEMIGHFGLIHQKSGDDDHTFALAAITMTIPFVGGGAATSTVF